MKFKTSISRPVKLGKFSTSERLPSRHALSQIVGGDPARRSVNNYAKKTPLDLAQMTPAGIDLAIAPKKARK